MSLRPAGIVLATLTALIAILGNWSGDALLPLLWRFPAALILAGLAYESVMAGRAHLTLAIESPEHWFLGRPGCLKFVFRHGSRHAVRMDIAPAAPDGFAADLTVRGLSVPAFEPAGFELRATPRRLGTHAMPAVRARLGGALRLAWWSKTLRVDCEVRVLPDLMRRGSGIEGLGTAGARIGPKRGAGSELRQLRPYQAGDPPRLVDWKATARARRLVSRDFSEDQHLEIVLAIDAGRASGLRAGHLDRFGHYVNVAAGLAQYAVYQGDHVGLIVFADRPLFVLAPARGLAAVSRIRAALGAARVEPIESNALHAAIRVRSLVRQRSLVVVLTDLDDTTVAGQLMSAVRLLRPKHLPFIAGLSSYAAEAAARAPANGWLDPYRAMAAQEYCMSLERKVRALRALGAPALVAKPDHLERAVFDAYSTFRRRRRV